MIKRIYLSLSALILVFLIAHQARAQGPASTPLEKVAASYPSRSITSFPILETARQKGFFQREGLNASIIYVRGGIDINALITGDTDYAAASTTAVTAFVAGAPLHLIAVPRPRTCFAGSLDSLFTSSDGLALNQSDAVQV